MQQAQASETLGPGSVRALKIVVVVMAGLILAGLALVAARIMQLSSKPELRSTPTATQLAEQAEIRLPAGGTVRSVSMSGHFLLLHYEAPTGSGIVITDATTGKTLSRIKLVPSAPAQ